ncbi:hypothetical protein [Ornithinibacillus scapharcae]|uniref:hypothetical protein n=1 Tax=Ornithinibacillus scapharcae TaxID=1147159 RepID=UPI000225B7DC|nr:hypothetical protein [Ornithinibacillus scapharcae]
MANQFTSEWNDEIIQRMLELAKIHKLPKVTKMINKEFGINKTYSSVRTKYLRVKDSFQPSVDPIKETGYKETIKYHEDGTVTKNTLIKIANSVDMTPTFLLQAHGFKPSEWKMIDCDNSVWNQHNKEDGTVTLYSSKIRVKPKENEIDILDLENIIKKLPTIHIPKNKSIKPSNLPYLNIPLYDMHWGIADYE